MKKILPMSGFAAPRVELHRVPVEVIVQMQDPPKVPSLKGYAIMPVEERVFLDL